MAYTTNPYLPKLRAKACKMIINEGKGVREIARYIGVSPGTISKWLQKYPACGARCIPTQSSRPHTHPSALDPAMIDLIVMKRKARKRCAEVIHQELLNDGIIISLSSVKRVLDRRDLTEKRSPWKRYHLNEKRPFVEHPGDLIQMDTIHIMTKEKQRIYVYTLIDLFSRWSYALAAEKISTHRTLSFVHKAQKQFPHAFNCLQSDHGPEFSQNFTERIRITHRHSRVRKPNDNAHIERFNRTLQEELLNQLPRDVRKINHALRAWLPYYNEERLHMGIGLKTPSQML